LQLLLPNQKENSVFSAATLSDAVSYSRAFSQMSVSL
jgi:hypothetical protein